MSDEQTQEDEEWSWQLLSCFNRVGLSRNKIAGSKAENCRTKYRVLTSDWQEKRNGIMVTKNGRGKGELSSSKKCLDTDDFYSHLTLLVQTLNCTLSLCIFKQIFSILKCNNSSGLSVIILYHRKELF